jgi:Gpi18-like mannosyltransferase
MNPINIATSIKSRYIIIATIIFGIATLARSTGILLAIFSFYLLVKKIVYRSDSFCAIYKYIFYFWCTVLIMIMPLGVVFLWKPYIMHCETKLDRTDAVPKWCLTEIPNVYSYI